MPLPAAIGLYLAADKVRFFIKWGSLLAIIISIILIILSIVSFTVWQNQGAGIGLAVTGGIILVISGLAFAITRKSVHERVFDTVNDVISSKKEGAAENFDKEINELDFLETEEEAKSKLPRKEMDREDNIVQVKPKKVTFKKND